MAAGTDTASGEVASISLKIPRNDKDDESEDSGRKLRYFKLPNETYTQEELVELGKKYEAMDIADVASELGEGALTDTSKLVSHNGKSYDEIVITDLEPGSYIFKETEESEQAHQYKFITIAETVEAGAKINELITKVTVRKKQPVILHKIAFKDETEETENIEDIYLEGVKFNLLDSDKNILSLLETAPGVYSYVENDDSAVTELVTNEDGNIIVNDLPEGSYIFHEIGAIEDYIIDKDNEYTDFDYNPYEEERLKVTNRKTEESLNINLHKYDGDTKESLAGVKFKLYIKTGDNYFPVGINENGQYAPVENSDLVFETGKNGYIRITDLPVLAAASSYAFREVEPADGYTLNADRFYDAKTNGTIEVANYKNPKPLELNLTKTDSVSGEALDRVGFELYRIAIEENEDGSLSETSERVTVYGENGSYDFTKGADNTTEEYQLYTDGDGRILVTGLPDGEYFFKENKVIEGYDLAENRGKESEKLSRDKKSAELTNKPEFPGVTPPDTPEGPTGGYNFVKVDDSKERNRLAGATFALYELSDDGKATPYQVDGQRYTVKSGSNGEFKVTGLPYGKYVLRETAAPAGYILDVKAIKFEVSATSINNEAIFIENKANPEKPPVVNPPNTPTPNKPNTPPSVTPPSTRTPVNPPKTYYVPSNTPGVTRGPLVNTGDIRIVILVIVGILMIVGGSFLVRKSEKEQKISLV